MPNDDIIHLIANEVALVDMSKFEAACRTGEPDQTPLSPRMLMTLLINGYSHGVRASRAIERLCRRDAGDRLIVGEHVPDYTVIARLRQRHAGEIKGLFLHVLGLCREAGLVRPGLVALDGTNVKAAASLDANRAARALDAAVERAPTDAVKRTRHHEDASRLGTGLQRSDRGDAGPDHPDSGRNHPG